MGVVLYAVSGGLKATFTTSYIHTVIIFVVLCVFMFKTYCGGGELGSISKVRHACLSFIHAPHVQALWHQSGS